MKPIFKILWIEDTPSIIRVQKDSIVKYLDDLDYELKLSTAIDRETFQKEFNSEQDIDIIVTDYNIEDNFNGMDVIKQIREKNKLTDILFYSAIEDTFKDMDIYSKIGHYGLVRICESKEIEEPLKELIMKNLQRFEDLIYLRGFVISRSIDLEIRLNDVISCYFQIRPDTIDEFHNFLLDGGAISLGSKKFLIQKILKTNGWIKDPDLQDLIELIKSISKERNLVAHCRRDPGNPKILVSSGKEREFSRESIHVLLNKIYLCEGKIEKLLEKCQN